MNYRLPAVQTCWTVAVPHSSFPQPKFRFGQMVEEHDRDEDGVLYCYRGVVVGMLFDVSYGGPGWSYVISWESASVPFGLTDDSPVPEGALVEVDAIA